MILQREMREYELETILAMMELDMWYTRLQIEALTRDVFCIDGNWQIAGKAMHNRLVRLHMLGYVWRQPHSVWNGMHYIIEYSYKLA